MICPSCGKMIPDNSTFCPECGTPFSYAAQAPVQSDPMAMGDYQYTTAPAKKSKLPIIIVAVVAVVLIVCGVIFGPKIINALGPKPEEAVTTYLDAYFEGDADAVIELYPEEFITYIEDEYDLEHDDLVKAVENNLKDLDYFDDWTVEYKVKKVKDGKERKIEKLKEACEDEMELKISDLKLVTVELKLEYEKDGDKDKDKEDITVPVVKSNGKWYVFCSPTNPEKGEKLIEDLIDD